MTKLRSIVNTLFWRAKNAHEQHYIKKCVVHKKDPAYSLLEQVTRNAELQCFCNSGVYTGL